MAANRSIGLPWALGGRPSRVLTFTIARGKIVQAEVIADPDRLRWLDVQILGE